MVFTYITSILTYIYHIMDSVQSTTDKKPFLSIKNLSKSFDEKIALDNFSLDVYKHEIIGIIGHSGSGKSTLLQLIFGLNDADSGEIKLESDRLRGRSEVLVPGDDRIKYVRQNYDLFPDHTIYENIEHQIRHLENEVVESRVNKLLTAFNITEIKHIKAKNVSGGEQQRVAICCALANSPKLLMLDEPLAHLDQINAKLIKDYLWKFVKSEKITTLFVTHNPQDALAYSSRLVIVNQGKVTESDTPFNLYSKPKTLYSAELLGNCFHISSQLIPKKHLLPKRGSYYLRPEMISINENSSLQTEVLSSTYYGDRQLITAKINRNKIEFFSYKNTKHKKGESLNITINYENVIFIPR